MSDRSLKEAGSSLAGCCRIISTPSLEISQDFSFLFHNFCALNEDQSIVLIIRTQLCLTSSFILDIFAFATIIAIFSVGLWNFTFLHKKMNWGATSAGESKQFSSALCDNDTTSERKITYCYVRKRSVTPLGHSGNLSNYLSCLVYF